jgi:hypothetical protein
MVGQCVKLCSKGKLWRVFAMRQGNKALWHDAAAASLGGSGFLLAPALIADGEFIRF